jgi:mono/diheme cytochrome c family protein
MTKFKISALLLLSFLMFNCTSAILEDEEIAPPPMTVKYNDEVKNITSANCVSCHGGSTPQAGLDLSSYVNVRSAVENGNLLNRINNQANPMPPSGILSSSTRALVDQWVADGYLEN